MTKKYTVVGHPVPKKEALDKVRGRFAYLADEGQQHMLYAVPVISERPHAWIKKIDSAKALAVPGFVRLFTAKDAPQNVYNSGEWFPGQEYHPDERILTDHARHVGDRIGLVVATSEAAARQAIKLLKIEYEDLPVVVDPMKAEEQSELLFPGEPSSFAGSLSYGNATEGRVVETHVQTPKIHHAAIETHLVFCRPLPAGAIEVQTPCQILYGVQHSIAEALNLPLNKIRVIKSAMGGTFGGKQEVVFEPLAAFACMRLGKPLLLTTNRRESILATRTRSATHGTIRTHFDDQGKILSTKVNVLLDAGAYISGAHNRLMVIGKKMPRLYRFPAFEYRGKVVRTNTTPCGACRGYGSPQSHALLEIHMDMAARELAIDPVQLRLNNLVHPGDGDLSGGSPLGNARAIECLTDGVKLFDWEARSKNSQQNGRYRTGVGFACATHGNGYYKTPFHDICAMSMRVNEDGTMIVRTALHELGNGTLTAVAQIVAEVFQTNVDSVTVTEGDTFLTPYDIGCQASRVIHVSGRCAQLLAEQVLEKVKNLAAIRLESSIHYVAIRDGMAFVTNQPEKKISVGELVRFSERRLMEEVQGHLNYQPQTNPGSYGAHFAQVRIDTLTGMVDVTDYLAVHDVGFAINPAYVEGQILGGVQMGIGMALTEELSFDAKGRPSCENFNKYTLINTTAMPDVRVHLIEKGEEGGPFGAKSIGEIATVPVAPAIVNAVNRALGTSLTDLPLVPPKIIAALG